MTYDTRSARCEGVVKQATVIRAGNCTGEELERAGRKILDDCQRDAAQSARCDRPFYGMCSFDRMPHFDVNVCIDGRNGCSCSRAS